MMKSKADKLTTKGERTFYMLNGIGMIIICLIFLYPLLYVLSRSVMTDAERIARPLAMIPRSLDFSGYKLIFAKNSNLPITYLTTIKRAIIGTACNLLFTAMFAYVLSKKKYPLRIQLTAMLALVMWFDGGLIPTYLLYRSYGLVNSFWAYVLPWLISPWYCIIMRNFFMNIPDELEESAFIDGANDFQIFYRIYLPLSKASLATIALFYAVWHWNQWFDSMLYMTERSKWTLQYVLRQIISSANMSDLMAETTDVSAKPPSEIIRMASTVATTLPILCVYPFIQKYFVKGVLVGSVKG